MLLHSDHKRTLWVPKGWGGEEILVNNQWYCAKNLYVMKGLKCSFHYHKLKHETFFVQKGKVKLYYLTTSKFSEVKNTGFVEVHNHILENMKEVLENNPHLFICKVLSVGDEFEIPPGLPHSFYGVYNSKILEVSTHSEDSDSYRIIKGN